MLASDILRLATRMFRTNRSRTVLTILGISVGIGTILFLVSLGYGIQQLILDRITTSDALLSLDVSTGDFEALKLDNDSIEDIFTIENVDKVSPLVTTQAQITINDISSELTANFADREFFRLDGTVLKKGDFYSDSEEDKNKIILSSASLRLFDISEEELFTKKLKFVFFTESSEEGKNTIVRDFIESELEFEVVGIVEEENSNYVYLPRNLGEELNFNRYSKLKVKVKKEEQLNVVRDSIIEKGYIVSALSDIIEQANQVFKVVQIVLASFGVVALIVSAIGMFNTMTIALLERTQEIGIMKALGATSVDVWNLFLSESVIIGFLGGVGGISLGLLGGEVFNYMINIMAGAFGGESIDLFATPIWFILTIIIFSTVVGLATGFYPARRAAKISAMEAVRYK
ncbi:MAG: ABC transporter permease [Patescibacteria group bacterium]|nr:ABC transporter permease [Patescibacteria group bacterium]